MLNKESKRRVVHPTIRRRQRGVEIKPRQGHDILTRPRDRPMVGWLIDS